MKPIMAWHFVDKMLMAGLPVPADGETLKHDGKIIMCCSGLHASRGIIDALYYARGTTICRVRCVGEIVEGVDKLVCRERTILWRVNGEKVLRSFACKQALSVSHQWDMPQIVREYLETQDESKRLSARDAALVAKYATRDALKYTAWYASRDAALYASKDAVLDAAWATAACAAACGLPAWHPTAARSTARSTANTMLAKMVIKEHRRQ